MTRKEPLPVGRLTDPSDLLRLAARRDHALLVVSQRVDGVIVSQVYTTMAAAERKMRRSADRGLPTSMVLVRLRPVAEATLDDLALIPEEVSP